MTETFRPLTLVPLRLAMSISRQHGGLTSTMKWNREKVLSFIGSRKWASFERPTMNVSCSRNAKTWPRCGPSVTVSVTIIRPPPNFSAPTGLLAGEILDETLVM